MRESGRPARIQRGIGRFRSVSVHPRDVGVGIAKRRVCRRLSVRPGSQHRDRGVVGAKVGRPGRRSLVALELPSLIRRCRPFGRAPAAVTYNHARVEETTSCHHFAGGPGGNRLVDQGASAAGAQGRGRSPAPLPIDATATAPGTGRPNRDQGDRPGLCRQARTSRNTIVPRIIGDRCRHHRRWRWNDRSQSRRLDQPGQSPARLTKP